MRYSEIIREEKRPTFYHGSSQPLDVGLILTADFSPKGRFQQVDEQCLEYYRPDGLISRSEAIFLATSLRDIKTAGGTNYQNLYVIEPIGVYERSNQYWLQLLYSLNDGGYGKKLGANFSVENLDNHGFDGGAIAKAAQGYWSGLKAGPRHDFHSEWGSTTTQSIWEYRCRKARVLSRV